MTEHNTTGLLKDCGEKYRTKQGQRDLSVRDSNHTRTSAASKTEISIDLEAQTQNSKAQTQNIKSQAQNIKSQTQNIKSQTQNIKARTQKISIDLNRSQNISNGKQPWNTKIKGETILGQEKSQ